MDIQREMQALLTSDVPFSIELQGRRVVVRMGDYLHTSAHMGTFTSFEQALHWLHEQHVSHSGRPHRRFSSVAGHLGERAPRKATCS